MGSPSLDVQKLGVAFRKRQDLLAAIQQEADTPSRIALFNEIAAFVSERLLSQLSDEQPASKRQRVGVDDSNGTAAIAEDAVVGKIPLLEVRDISVAAPVRKKVDLVCTETFLYARQSGATKPLEGCAWRWREVEHILYLPVPEKAQVQHNYVLLPRGGYLPYAASVDKAIPTASALEPLVFTVPATAPKPGTVSGSLAASAAAVADSFSTLFHWALSTFLRDAGIHSVSIVASDPAKFRSVARQPQRPNEPAVHIKAFRGSKDGYLFFLPTGIFFGFKKPVVFIPLGRIVSVSYTSVLQRTFDMVVEYEDGEGTVVEMLFGMLDQEDYGGIDETYIKKYGLANRSMAEQRRARLLLKENGVKREEGVMNGAAGGEGDYMSELERAAKEAEIQMQDEEDEEEEDYDPGSEGESEGSGSSNGEEDGGEAGEEEGDEAL